MPHKHTFRASKGNGGFTHAQRPGHKGDSGFSFATHCTEKASNAASEVWTRHLCGDEGARPGSETTRQSATRPHRCGGRRRDRRARAGFETRHRAKRSRLVSRAAGPSGAQNTRGATSNTRRKDDAPSEARSADGQRAGRRPPAHTAAGPDSARNTSSATSNISRATAQAPTPHRGAGPRPLALQLRRERSEVRASGVAQLAQLVDRGNPAAALAFGGEQVHAADR